MSTYTELIEALEVATALDNWQEALSLCEEAIRRAPCSWSRKALMAERKAIASQLKAQSGVIGWLRSMASR